jgi:hypothetical protein
MYYKGGIGCFIQNAYALVAIFHQSEVMRYFQVSPLTASELSAPCSQDIYVLKCARQSYKGISPLLWLHPKLRWICLKADDCILLTWRSLI